MKTFTILAFATLLSSCTEEISEELKNSQSQSSQNRTPDLSDSKITLKHLMDERMSFELHKAGTIDAPCELTPPDSDGFSASTYYRDPSLSPKPQVIDCILEAQEQDLYKEGAKFELSVDEQLCEYIEYEPYKFVEMPFGNTSKTVYEVTCTTSEDDCNTGGFCDKLYDNYNGAGIATTSNLTNALNPDGKFCEFDYSSGSYGENCDQGSVRYQVLNINNARVPVMVDDDGDPSTPDVEVMQCPQAANTYSLVPDGSYSKSCGGDHGSCMGGPAIEQLGNADYAAEIYENTELKEFVKDWEIQAPIDRQDEGIGAVHSNMYLANFSRICSDSSIVKDESGADYSVYNSLSLKGHHVESLRFDPNNQPRRIFPRENFDSSGTETDSWSHAENPWRSTRHTSPYYAFRCLDQARDVKAQIRLFIRDWDRTYEEPVSAFASVSDIGTVVPLIDSNASHDDDPWNDIRDWDDWFALTDQFVWLDNKCEETTGATQFDPIIFPGHL